MSLLLGGDASVKTSMQSDNHSQFACVYPPIMSVKMMICVPFSFLRIFNRRLSVFDIALLVTGIYDDDGLTLKISNRGAFE
jgi:hypothetical protein